MAARYLADVPYPAFARSLQDSLDASAAAIAATDLPSAQKVLASLDAQRQLESYHRSAFDRATIVRRFDDIADWARDNGVPSHRIILGRGAPSSTLPSWRRLGLPDDALFIAAAKHCPM
jgi:endoglucanase